MTHQSIRPIPLRFCKYCEKERAWIFSHYRQDGRRAKIYVDLNGSHWNSAKCPQCQALAIRKRRERTKGQKITKRTKINWRYENEALS